MEERIFFAKTNFRNKERIFGIKTADRRQHMYVVGKSGTGKTTLLENLAVQDIINGHGVCIVDPHGEFVENIVARIPANRINDVVYFNPADSEYPIGFNVLEVSDQKYKHLIASDLMGIFTKIWANVWSARMEYILSNCVLALIETPGTTLLGIPRILTDKDYRQKIVSNIKDPVVKAFWIHEFETWREQFRNEAIVPIQNKVGQFLSTSLIRNIVGQPKSTINVREIMDNEKILLVNVSKGRVGEDNSDLLGAMFITKIQLAAMERVRIDPSKRKDFYLYVDEFQNFATESFASILSEARKYRLNLIIAHQYIGQLMVDNLTTLKDAIFGNVGSMITFRVGAADAEFLEKEFEPEFNAQDLINLPNRNIYLKLMVDGTTSRPFSGATLPPFAIASTPENEAKVIESSRKQYGRPRVKVETEIIQFSGMVSVGGQRAGGPAEGFKKEGFREKGDFKGGGEFKRGAGGGERSQQFKYPDTLPDLGIEFEPHKKPFSLMEKMAEKEKPVESAAKKEEKFLSLEALQKSAEPQKMPPQKTQGEEIKKEKREIPKKTPSLNVDELKEAISKALNKPAPPEK